METTILRLPGLLAAIFGLSAAGRNGIRSPPPLAADARRRRHHFQLNGVGVPTRMPATTQMHDFPSEQGIYAQLRFRWLTLPRGCATPDGSGNGKQERADDGAFGGKGPDF
jgi:hypothetical protein